MKYSSMIFIITCAIILPGCASTVTLGNVHSIAGVTEQRRDIDIINCKEEAQIAVNSPVNQTADFLLGASLIGIPFAASKNKSIQRDAFALCMSSRGYRVDTPDGKSLLPNSEHAFSNHRSVPHAIDTSARQAAFEHSIALPAGWEVRPVPEVLMQSGVSYYALNVTKDTALAISSLNGANIESLSELAKSYQAAQISLLKDARGYEVQAIKLNGRPAYRYRVDGSYQGMKITYLTTILMDESSVIHMNAWTSNSNFPRVQDDMENLSNLIVWRDHSDSSSEP